MSFGKTEIILTDPPLANKIKVEENWIQIVVQ